MNQALGDDFFLTKKRSGGSEDTFEDVYFTKIFFFTTCITIYACGLFFRFPGRGVQMTAAVAVSIQRRVPRGDLPIFDLYDNVFNISFFLIYLIIILLDALGIRLCNYYVGSTILSSALMDVILEDAHDVTVIGTL
ncbi:hypothetical protein ACJX0J_035149, partial [Zea mays]